MSLDTVIRRLERPQQVLGQPQHVSVLGQSVLVCYGDNNLVTYHRDSPTPSRVLQAQEGLVGVTSITTDSCPSNFFVTGDKDDDSSSVFVLDEKLLLHRIYTGHQWLYDCAVVQSQLWLGYWLGYITVLKSP